MNTAENEQKQNMTENIQHRENPEGSLSEQNREMERLFENHKQERITVIDSETKEVLKGADKRMESVMSIGYTPEQVQQFKQEQNIDEKLEQNRQQIKDLGVEAQTKIEAIQSTEAIPKKPTAKNEQTENTSEK